MLKKDWADEQSDDESNEMMQPLINSQNDADQSQQQGRNVQQPQKQEIYQLSVAKHHITQKEEYPSTQMQEKAQNQGYYYQEQYDQEAQQYEMLQWIDQMQLPIKIYLSNINF